MAGKSKSKSQAVRIRECPPFAKNAKDGPPATEDAPLSAVFGGRGFRPLKPYDFVPAFEVAVSAGDSITADSAKAVQSPNNHNSCSRNPQPVGLAQGRLFEPREDQGSLR